MFIQSRFRFLPALLTIFVMLCSTASISATGDYRHYLPGGSVMVETIQQETGAGAGSGNSTGTKVLYYGYQDHLGSLTALVRERINGNGSIGRIVADYRSYDAWGRLRENDDWALPRTTDLQITDRGYTGHEHLTDFGIINMNGRVYDPLTAQFFSPDPYVQAPGLWLNYNRYAYCLNNPLIYTDPDGEFWWIPVLIGAYMGGVSMNDHQFNPFKWDYKNGQTYAGIVVGALAGAVGAGIEGGMSSLLAGGSFKAGFWGTKAALTATSSFLNGAAISGSSGFATGFITGFANRMIQGHSIKGSLKSGLIDGLIGGVGGALIGGTLSGINAYNDGRRFWDGANVVDEVLVDQDIPIVGQSGMYDCLPASAEAIDRSFGGNLTQEDVKGWNLKNQSPYEDKELWERYAAYKSLKIKSLKANADSPDFILWTMQNNGRVAITLNTGEDIAHSVVMKSIVQRNITKINGTRLTKYIYRAMNPANGGYMMRLPERSIRYSKSIFYFIH